MTGMITFGITRLVLKQTGESACCWISKAITVVCSDDSEGKRVKRVCAFYDERYGKNRSITDVDWSPKVKILWRLRPASDSIAVS